MIRRSIFVVAFVLMATACKYDSPLTDKPTRDIDAALLGHWFSLKDGEPLDVYRLAHDQFLVSFRAFRGDEPYVCTHSDLAGTNFVSCQYIGHDKDSYGKFAYAAYKIDKGELVLMYLDDDALDIKSLTPGERRAAVEKAAKEGKAIDKKPENIGRFKKQVEEEKKD